MAGPQDPPLGTDSTVAGRLTINPTVLERANPNEGAITRVEAAVLLRDLFSTIPRATEEQSDGYDNPVDRAVGGLLDSATGLPDDIGQFLAGTNDAVTGVAAGPSDLVLLEIAKALPEEALRPSVIAQLSGTQLASYVARSVTVDPNVRAAAKDLVAVQHAAEDQQIVEYAASIGVTDPVQIEQQQARFRATLASDELTPSTASEIGQNAIEQSTEQGASEFAQEVATGGLLTLNSEAKLARQVVLSPNDFQNLFRQNDPDQALRYLNTTTKFPDGTDIPGGRSMGDLGNIAFSATGGQQQSRPDAESFMGGQRNVGPGRQSYTLTEVQNLLYTMSPKELSDITARMKKAGLFPKSSANARSSDGMPVPGDPDDPTLRGAWQTLIGQSVRTGKPMVELLDEKSGVLLSTGVLDVDGNPVDHTRIQLSDPDRIRMNADASANKLIGRYLKDDELDSIVQMIHSFETTDAADVASESDDPYVALDQNAKIDAYIKLMVPPDLNNNGDVDKGEHWTPESLAAHLTGGHRELAGANRAVADYEPEPIESPSAPTATRRAI